MESKTIAAIATPPGAGGVAIIRVSGPKAERVLRRVFSREGAYDHARMYYGDVRRDGELLDRGLAVLFRAPHSFTGEDVAELHLHGGELGAGRVLRLVLEGGAAPAQPGEFSRRAFLNGKMDLTQAEAVCDYIGAVCEAGARSSARQMEGGLKERALRCQDMLTDVLAQVEAAVEYPEEDLETEIAAGAVPALEEIKKQVDELADSFARGRIFKNGLRVTIAGKPNAGKSSLLNALAGQDRVIVSDVAGTTRDTVEQGFLLNDIVVYLTDTAGIRRTEDKIEQMGVERSENALKSADIVLFTLDSAAKWDEKDDLAWDRLKGSGADHWVVLNKIDASERLLGEEDLERFRSETIPVSAKTGEGLDALKERLYVFATGGNNTEDVLITSERHREILERVAALLEEATRAISKGADMDCVTIDLNAAWLALGELTGNTVSEEIIDRVFTKFCLGK